MQLILKLGILLSIMSFDYQEYTSKFSRQWHTISGLIIYDYSSPVPQNVIMIPCEVRPGQDLNSLVEEHLLNNKTEGMFIYFQSIRWTMPDVEESLTQWDFIEAKAIDGYFNKAPLRIGYGKITFDKSDEDSEEGDDVIRETVISVLGTDVKLKVAELPKAVGPAKLFEKVNL